MAFDQAHADTLDELKAIAAQRDELRNTLALILSYFTERGHPGFPALRTSWIRQSTHSEWWETVKRNASERVT